MPGSARARSWRWPSPPRSARLHGLALDVEADALVLDRAARSGLGTGLFLQGGLALDGGRGAADRPAPIIARLPFPGGLAHPARPRSRAPRASTAPEEIAAFRTLAGIPGRARRAIFAGLRSCRRCRPSPSATLRAFGRAVTEIQTHVGDYFGAAQGGRFASRERRRRPRTPRRERRRRLWPELLGADRLRLRRVARRSAQAAGHRCAARRGARGLELRIVKGRNSGAAISERLRAVKQGARHG